jgi:translation initiation factor IF-3
LWSEGGFGIKKDGSKKTRINDDIPATTVRLIGATGEQVGIVSIADALKAAQEAKLDLVEIAPDADPVVCKILDYGKHIFEAKKDNAAARKKQRRMQVKEMKFRPGTEEGDYQVKLRNLTRFLTDGDKAKVTLRFRGREMAHQELGMDLLKRIEADLAEIGSVEMFPKMEGRQLTMVIAPNTKKKGSSEAIA